MSASGLPSRMLTCCRWSRPGGFYRRFERMMLALAAAGTEVHYAAAREFPCRHERIVFHPMRLPLVTREGLLPWAVFFALARGELARMARSVRPEAILAFDGVYGWLMARAAKEQGVPFAVFCRRRPAAYRHRIERRLARDGFRSATSIVVQARCTIPAMEAWTGMPPEVMSILPNDAPEQAPDAEARSAARRALLQLTGFPADSFVAVTAGRIDRFKGLGTILRAAALIEDPRARLVILGDGPERRHFQALATEVGLTGKFAFPGWRQDVGTLLAGCDLFLSASSTEGAPNALLEALGAGLPCLGGDIPEVEEILARPELLYPVDSAEALAERWKRLVLDEAAQVACRQISRERAQAYTFDWDRALCEVVAKACSTRNSSAIS